MRYRFKHLLFALIFLFLFGFILAPHAGSSEDKDMPKNIILFIGDGMGIGQVSAAKVVKGTLNIEQCKTVGLLTTQGSDAFIPTSESTTTPLATGVNSRLWYIAISLSKEPLKTILEYAEEKGKSTGLVVTSNVVDATPACFVAHTDARKNTGAIAEAIVDSGVDVLFGGGLRYFLPSQAGDSASKDNKGLIARLEKRYPVVTTKEGFEKLETPKGAYGFFAMDNLPGSKEREISLAEMTRKAIDILSTNENGFFLMVEGSQIDWAGHRGDSEKIIRETIDLDDAAGEGLEFAKYDGATLVIVTADHESGGYCFTDGSANKHSIRTAVFATSGHTGAMLPLFAYGPGSEVLGGIHDHAFVGKTIIGYVKERGAQDGRSK